MRNILLLLVIIIIVLSLGLFNCSANKDGYRTISVEVLKDKISGGWAGKMIGVSYGGPTEFRYNGVINEDPIDWYNTAFSAYYVYVKKL